MRFCLGQQNSLVTAFVMMLVLTPISHTSCVDATRSGIEPPPDSTTKKFDEVIERLSPEKRKEFDKALTDTVFGTSFEDFLIKAFANSLGYELERIQKSMDFLHLSSQEMAFLESLSATDTDNSWFADLVDVYISSENCILTSSIVFFSKSKSNENIDDIIECDITFFELPVLHMARIYSPYVQDNTVLVTVQLLDVSLVDGNMRFSNIANVTRFFVLDLSLDTEK